MTVLTTLQYLYGEPRSGALLRQQADDFIVEELSELPARWNQYPYSSKTAGVFTKLATNRDFFALKVPSTIVPMEHNYILNPLYKEFGKVEIVEFIDLEVDSRLKEDKR